MTATPFVVIKRFFFELQRVAFVFVMSWAFVMGFVFALLVLLVTLAKCIAGAHYIWYLVFRPVLFRLRSNDLSCPVL